MQALRQSIVSHRHLAWVMWIALLLPIAQVAASWHVLSHASAASYDAGDEKTAPHQAHCDLCVTAAAVSGGALIGDPPSIPHRAVHHEPPQAATVFTWLATPLQAYRSRAPPVASL